MSNEPRCRCGVLIAVHREMSECAGEPDFQEMSAEEIAEEIGEPPTPTPEDMAASAAARPHFEAMLRRFASGA